MIQSLQAFDRVVVFDTETTGIEFGRDRIIEIGAASWENGQETGSFDCFLRLPDEQRLPPFIVELTGITDAQLQAEGVSEQEAAESFRDLLAGAEHPLLAAYNAQFDLNFLFHLLQPLGMVSILQPPRFLDVLTVYRDRRDYPHKLENAIQAYCLEDRVAAARAAAALMEAMAEERDDLDRYLDLFGTHPKYGLSGRRISSVTYRSQPYQRTAPLYEL